MVVKTNNVVEGLKTLLADTFVLYLKTHKFHWNVEGQDFYELHIFLEKLYNEIWEAVDDIAEHIRALGDYSPGSFTEFNQLTYLKESTATKVKAMDMLKELLKDHETLMAHAKEVVEAAEAAGDTVTADFVTLRLDAHQKHAWMLRSFLR